MLVVSEQVVLACASSDVAVSASSRSVAVTVGRRLGGVSRGLAEYCRAERGRGDAVDGSVRCNSSSARELDATGRCNLLELDGLFSDLAYEVWAGSAILSICCSPQAHGGI